MKFNGKHNKRISSAVCLNALIGILVSLACPQLYAESSSQNQSARTATNDGAKAHKKSQNLNTAAGTAFGAMCAQQIYSACGSAVLSIAQAMISRNNAKQTNLAYNALNNNQNNKEKETNDSNITQADIDANSDIQNYLKTMGDAKYNLKDQTFTMGDGTQYSAGAFASAQGMRDAGFSEQDIAAFEKTLEKIKEDINGNDLSVVSMGFNSSGGGKKSAAKKTVQKKELIGAIQGRLGPKRGQLKNRELASLAKNPFRKVGSDKIGLKSDDIFKMIHRRYQIKSQAGDFKTSHPQQIIEYAD